MTQGENIRKELEEIVPNMHWHLPKPDFSVPDDYFAGFTRTVLDKIHREEETEEKIFTRDFSKRNVFTVPDGYFDTAPQNVLEKIQAPHRIISLPRRRKYGKNWAVAAAIAAFVALAGILGMPGNAPQNRFNIRLADISEIAIEQYLYTNMSASNPEEIFDYLSASGIQNTITHNFSTHDIEEYLENNAYLPDR